MILDHCLSMLVYVNVITPQRVWVLSRRGPNLSGTPRSHPSGSGPLPLIKIVSHDAGHPRLSYYKTPGLNSTPQHCLATFLLSKITPKTSNEMNVFVQL